MIKRIKIILLSVLSVFIICLSFNKIYIQTVKADSGWDSDYDSGSSWDNDYDYDYDYDDDYDYDYDDDYDYDSDYSSSGGSNGDYSGGTISFSLFLIILIFVLGYVFISSLIRNSLRKMINISYKDREMRRREYLKNKPERQVYNKLTQEQANKIIPNFDIEEFNFKAYQNFFEVQMAWMNFDYDKLKELLTDELYNSYVMDLDALKLKKQKNTMKGFELIDSHIYELKEENGYYVAKVYIDVKFYDYIESIETGNILRGTNSRKLNNTYILTFVRSKEDSNKLNECPSCGAPVEGNTTGTCEYCKSKLINKNYDWVMSKKEKIYQK